MVWARATTINKAKMWGMWGYAANAFLAASYVPWYTFVSSLYAMALYLSVRVLCHSKYDINRRLQTNTHRNRTRQIDHFFPTAALQTSWPRIPPASRP